MESFNFFKVETDGSGGYTKTPQGAELTSTNGIDFKGSGSFAATLHSTSHYVEAYFDADEWWGTPSAGFTALCTQDIPTPATENPQDYFKCVKYTLPGLNNTAFNVPVGFDADLHWVKCTDAGEQHYLFDTVRNTGTTYNKFLNSDSNNSESAADNNITNAQVTKISNGFSVQTPDQTSGELYFGTRTYIAWNWRAGGSPTANDKAMIDGVEKTITGDAVLDAGTITPTKISANTKAGFSIIQYVGTRTSTASDTMSHGLSSAPELLLMKNLDKNAHWSAYTIHAAGGGYLSLTDAWGTSRATWMVNDQNPTNSLITVGWNADNVNQNGDNHLIYAWHSVPGYSAFGSYKGNNTDNDGVFVYTGFKPAVLILRSSDASTGRDWIIVDNARSPHNPIDHVLMPNTSGVENTLYDNPVDFLSNGFKLKTNEANFNAAETHIYAAFAEQPTNFTTAR